jgi:hypothetical protein
MVVAGATNCNFVGQQVASAIRPTAVVPLSAFALDKGDGHDLMHI